MRTSGGLWSVRSRVTLLATAVTAVALLAAALLLLAATEGSLIDARDTAARARLEDLAALVEAGALPAELEVRQEDDIAQVVDRGGRVVAASSDIAGESRVSELTPSAGEDAVRTERDLVVDGEAEDYRIWARSVGGVVVYVGASLEQVGEAVATLRWSLLIGLPALLLVLAGMTWWVVGRALRPVEAIRSEVADISAEDLDRRVPVPPQFDEIGRLAMTMNEMLDRLESAALRERQFLADAAHELQSPLSAFRAHLEVSRAHPQETDWIETLDELLAESRRLEQLVHDLLFLARIESGQVEVGEDLLDLDDVVAVEVARVRPGADARIDATKVSAAPVRGSRDELGRLVRNLLDNTCRHAASSVTVSLRAEDASARLVICDDGPGIPAERRAQVLERFVRLDTARSRADSGTGLGLSIARDIAVRHGGSLQVEEATGGGACFVVLLPLATFDAETVSEPAQRLP
jgi:signal transduction histidine kinase